MTLSDKRREAIIQKILGSRKYRHLGVNAETVNDLITRLAPIHPGEKALYKAVRTKLHNIVAPYLGEPDYHTLTPRLNQITNPTLDDPALRALCREALQAHASTAERLPDQEAFYERLFAAVGQPASILDLACGLHPLAFPWMGLPPSTRYNAYDILQPRVDFINRFFQTVGLKPLAENRDVLVNPPTQSADLGIFFKEAHRFEKRQPDANRGFWERLNVRVLAVSLPTHNLTGDHSLLEQHRALVYANLSDNMTVEELSFSNEIVFLIRKGGGTNYG